jgi:hypothetical protein
MKHLIFDIILFIVILTCPWWVSALLAVFLLYYLCTFNEIVIFGLFMDILYGQGNYTFTIVFLVLLISSFYIKKRLKFYSK